MSLKIGIVGLPNVGKSTLFNALTKSAGAEMANYPFCTIDPNVGIVEVPDKRMDELSDIVHPQKKVPATIEFVDIAGLVEGASTGEGLGNKFLAHIRECDAIAQVVRCFSDTNITHVSGEIMPKNDIEIINTELLLADLQTLEKRFHKTQKEARGNNKEAIEEFELLKKLIPFLEQGNLAIQFDRTEDETLIMKSLHLLTNKPFLFIANVQDEEVATFDAEQTKKDLGLPDKSTIVPISAKIEMELSQMTEEDAALFLEDLQLTESGLHRLIRSSYKCLDLSTFFTAGVTEVRAWTIPTGAKGPQAAGVIHSDFEKGFIRAEVIFWEDFVQFGGESGARDSGKMRVEGKDYIVKDGDVCHFRCQA